MTYTTYKNRVRLLLISALLLLFSAWCLAQRSQGQSWAEYYTAPDKILHAGAGFAISGLATTIYASSRPDEPLINAAGVGFLSGTFFGAVKEIGIDHYGGLGTPDAGDFFATQMGSAIGALTTALSIRISRSWLQKRHEKRTQPVVKFDANWNPVYHGA